MNTAGLAHEVTVLSPPRHRTLEGEAARRGFLRRDGRPNTRRFADWCARHGVELLGAGKTRWVRPEDIDRAIERAAAPAVDGAALSEIERAMATLPPRRAR